MAYTTIDNPELYFQIVTYTGDGNTGRSITLPGDTDMQPDLVWLKSRGEAEHHQLTDSVRGVNKQLYSHLAYGEATETDRITAFNSDGFTIEDDVIVNKDTVAFVAWCWKAGGSGSSNEDGSINTTATSANADAGFSIVSWTGSDANATIGHGLSSAPEFITIKNRTDTSSWLTYLTTIGAGNFLRLNETNASASGSTPFNDTASTSSVFSVGANNDTNGSSDSMIAYCFSSVQGFSKVGSYTGNGDDDGAFIYTGFKPAWVLTKQTNSTNHWHIHDNKRNSFNVVGKNLKADANNVEEDPAGGENSRDFLSNGFKFRDADHNNGDGVPYIYMAFAEAPFVNSNGVPCNAR